MKVEFLDHELTRAKILRRNWADLKPWQLLEAYVIVIKVDVMDNDNGSRKTIKYKKDYWVYEDSKVYVEGYDTVFPTKVALVLRDAADAILDQRARVARQVKVDELARKKGNPWRVVTDPPKAQLIAWTPKD